MDGVNQRYTLSEYERLALENRVNLSDGHARHTLSTRQRDVIGKTLHYFDVSLTVPQKDVEKDFLSWFFCCAAQGVVSDGLDTFLTFSSSSAIKMAAQYCRMSGLTVYLIEPCFDNIFHILRTEGVNVKPVYEAHLGDLDFVDQLLGPSVALWLVQPNNPTGFCIDEPLFKQLISKVAEKKSTLIIDFCFRLYADNLRLWDQYRYLNESEIKFICFEDTGKTWSLADIKVGISVCSRDIAPLIYRLHDELLLNISPLQLILLTEFIKDSLTNGFYDSVRHPIETNRALIHNLVDQGLIIHASEWCQNVPMELLRLPDQILSSVFWSALRQRGVEVLPATNYFWSRAMEGTSLFRIPLSRPRRDFDVAIPIMRQTLCDLRLS